MSLCCDCSIVQGCSQAGGGGGEAPPIRLSVDESGGAMREPQLRSGLRCMRLLVYEPEEAAWALRTGYLSHSLLEVRREAFDEHETDNYDACVRKARDANPSSRARSVSFLACDALQSAL